MNDHQEELAEEIQRILSEYKSSNFSRNCFNYFGFL